MDAVTIERDGKPPREAKLGAFRLSGLSDVRPTQEPYGPAVGVPLQSERYMGAILARL